MPWLGAPDIKKDYNYEYNLKVKINEKRFFWNNNLEIEYCYLVLRYQQNVGEVDLGRILWTLI